jgi:hypothetical protein
VSGAAQDIGEVLLVLGEPSVPLVEFLANIGEFLLSGAHHAASRFLMAGSESDALP